MRVHKLRRAATGSGSSAGAVLGWGLGRTSSNCSSDPKRSRIASSTAARSAGLKQRASRHEKFVIHCASFSVRPVRLKGQKEDGQSRESSSILDEGASVLCMPCR